MENVNIATTAVAVQAPPLALPDAEAARRAVGRWLRTELGDALYPAEASFVPESFAWRVSVWFSTADRPMSALVADVYLSAATGIFLGRPSHDDLTKRLKRVLISRQTFEDAWESADRECLVIKAGRTM